MHINGIKLCSKLGIIRTTTTHISHLCQIGIIFVDRHHSGDRAFNRSLIQNTGRIDTILWQSLFGILCHDGNGTTAADRLIYPFSGQIRFDLSVMVDFFLFFNDLFGLPIIFFLMGDNKCSSASCERHYNGTDNADQCFLRHSFLPPS